jgi:hypothetical protein
LARHDTEPDSSNGDRPEKKEERRSASACRHTKLMPARRARFDFRSGYHDIVSDVFILSAARTPIGKFGGALSTVPATDLGATAN